jgi:hypothetical protein
MNFNCILISRLLLILVSVISCSAQEEVKITIHNFSSYKIDSIVIPEKSEKGLDKLVFNTSIDTNQSETFKIALDKSKLWHEGSFWIVIYAKNKIWEDSWGFHDMGYIINDTINVYDNGLSKGKHPLKRPEELTVYFINKDKTEKIDSIVSPVVIEEKIQRSIVNDVEKQDTETRIITFDFDKIKETPEFEVWISGKNYKVIIEHDFDDWNNNQEFLYFNEGTISKQVLTPTDQ